MIPATRATRPRWIQRVAGLLIVVALVVLLPACERLRGGSTPDPATPDPGISHADGDALLLRVEHVGGFAPPEYLLTSMPTFTLLGDGRVIVTGPQIEIYPGPALPNLQVRRLSERGIQAVLRVALDSGQLDADREWGDARRHVADAPDTVFTLQAGGREVSVRVYALGIVDPDMPDISPAEREAHAALSALLDRLIDLDSWIGVDGWADGGWQPYRADALRLVVREVGDDPGPDDIPYRERQWPTPGIDPAAFGTPTWDDLTRCGIVDGPAAGDWYRALGGADQLTRWASGERTYAVMVRPLLPDEAPGCPPAA